MSNRILTPYAAMVMVTADIKALIHDDMGSPPEPVPILDEDVDTLPDYP